MKIAISVPDTIYEDAERLASKLGTSRSEIFARAMQEFSHKHQPDNVTDTLNAVIDQISSDDEKMRKQSACKIFEKLDW